MKAFFKEVLYLLHVVAFDSNKGWVKRVVKEFMDKKNLHFATKKIYNGNSLQNLCTQEKNMAVKNKARCIKEYTGMYINLIQPPEIV